MWCGQCLKAWNVAGRATMDRGWNWVWEYEELQRPSDTKHQIIANHHLHFTFKVYRSNWPKWALRHWGTENRWGGASANPHSQALGPPLTLTSALACPLSSVLCLDIGLKPHLEYIWLSSVELPRPLTWHFPSVEKVCKFLSTPQLIPQLKLF